MLKTIGSDMEVFAMNKQGEHIALCGMIGGTKEEPMPIKGLPYDGFFIQEDNVALEFNVPVSTTRLRFINSFKIMRQYINIKLTQMGLQMSNNSSFSFANEQLHHPNALVFGCEPDYSAWKMVENTKPQSKNKNLRTCGGHIHVGTDSHMVDAVRKMDLYLGVPSILLDDNPASIARRELYGKSGAMRPKPYGFEYRVLSNFWMFDDELVGWVFDNTKRACSSTSKITDKEGKHIQECIDTGNKELAQELVSKWAINMPIVLSAPADSESPF